MTDLTIIGGGMLAASALAFFPLWILTTRDIGRRARQRQTARQHPDSTTPRQETAP